MSSKYNTTTDTHRQSVLAEHTTSPSHSGSKDVSARILKKRESDRRCQRIKRERTKSKIAALEERVRHFGKQDSTGQVQSLMQQLQTVERERDDLAKKVKTIEDVIREDTGKGSSDQEPARIQESLGSGHASSSIGEPFEYDVADSETQLYGGEHGTELPGFDGRDEVADTPYEHSIANPGLVADGGFRDSFDNVSPTLNANNKAHPPSPTGQPCECCTISGSGNSASQFNTWRFTNQVLSSRFKWPAYFQMLQDNYRDDIPVRVVVEGWDAIDTQGPLHPSWQILKKIDQVLFGRMGVAERLAVIYSTQLLLMSHTSVEELPDLPHFYRKRPSQNLADSYAIHFFPWPGVRERFVFNQHRYCTNTFWSIFINSLRLVWPFEIRDCYTKNTETGQYAISSLFRERVNDIKCWAMDPDIFQKWPELRADIPVYNSIPPSVSNMVRRPRPTPRNPQSDTMRVARAKANTQALQRQMSAQAYSYPGNIGSLPTYYQHSMYGMDGKMTPNMAWPEDQSPQSTRLPSYYASMTNPTNISGNP